MPTTKEPMADPDVRMMITMSAKLKGDYLEARSRVWKGSPFEWILTLPSRQRGKVGEQLIAGWAALRNLNVARSPDSQADKIIENQRIEIKFSTLWQSGVYTFQQIRDQNYEYLVCLGISPADVHGWIFKKEDIPFSKLEHQHGGKAGRDTWWISVVPGQAPAWMGMYGQTGRLSDVYRILSEGTGSQSE